MKLDHIAIDRLRVSRLNMRQGARPPDIADILPTIRARGILQPLIVRRIDPAPGEGSGDISAPSPTHEILAGRRRYHAACALLAEQRAAGACDPELAQLPCAILEAGEDAAALEASLIENVARRDPHEVEQWGAFVRLIRSGQRPEEIGAHFGLTDLAVRRILALGNLLPRIRALYARDEINRGTIRLLTLGSKSQQRAWLALLDDPEARAPMGASLRAWLLGGQAIAVRHARFDVAASGLATIADLFGEEAYFVDAEAFWIAQKDAIERIRADWLAAGWQDVVILPPGEHFPLWEYQKTAKRKGGRVYVDLRANGEVVVHEGYLSRREARRAEAGEAGDTPPKPIRPELSAALNAYVDLHRRAAAHAAMLERPDVALRLMLAHLLTRAPSLSAQADDAVPRHEAVAQSLAQCRAEMVFGAARAKAIAALGIEGDAPSLARASGRDTLVPLFDRLLGLPDDTVMAILAVLMGECLASGSPAVDALGMALGLDMREWWQTDNGLPALVRERELLLALLGEMAGDTVAQANAREKGATLRQIIGHYLEGASGRQVPRGWLPRWLGFPPAAYSGRGGVGSVRAHQAMLDARTAASAPPDKDDETGRSAVPGAAAIPGMERSGPPDDEDLAA
jgi:ParB family chromosome partitioning protein